MQTTPAPFVPPPPQNGYQPLSEAEIYAIKKQYLGLLPIQQIIDICLTFEAHAPLPLKSSVWPYDIRAAIASILAQKVQVSQTLPSSESNTSTETPAPDSSSGEISAQPQPSSSQQSTPTLTQVGPTGSAPSISQPAGSQPQSSPATPGPHYPHQPYYHPHTPYYASHRTYGYPPPYPPYPQPAGMYPVNPAGHHPPLFTNAPLAHPTHPPSEAPPPLNNVDDLPSYEEMIVEALLISGDPEGCAPKSLFTWMAMHYPLQMNFRPSASQALQKAFKRGRLEKGSNGKYRLNENWEGGSTSKRTTRRPQTLAQSALPGPQQSSSPFTQAPLVPPGATSLAPRLPPPGQPPGYGGYPFVYSYQNMPGSAPPAVPRDGSRSTPQKQATNTGDHETGEGSDAWEAAQNILKAINFGQLFQMSGEENGVGESSTSASSLNQHTTASNSHNPSPALASNVMAVEESAGGRIGGTGKPTELNAEQRAALQAQLALLAAQLAEMADVSEDELSHNLEASERAVAMSNAHTPQVLGEGSGMDNGDDCGDDEDKEDMIEVSMPMEALASRVERNVHDLAS